MTMHDVSVALATYHGESFLAAQLRSLEEQTLRPAELVVCDDRSSDGTVEVLRDFAANASFPVTIHVNDQRLGWRANFMKAAGLCTSELIALCDQDDVWYPAKLRTMSALFDDPEVILAHHGADLIDAVRRDRPTLPIVLVTGYMNVSGALPSDVPRLGKPFNAGELLDSLDRAFAAAAPAD